ncbi:MAG TPA: F0F1 ATP synthase subunit alpha [Spirochaetia bacterium]|nr:MAG: F0F1 ATP synthase subunit alpha [Spirochaetes bacterium GWB1_36_13]HCL57203.1 F0F1 ATP synthase subunit alpha [Spirochaetia bacterium]
MNIPLNEMSAVLKEKIKSHQKISMDVKNVGYVMEVGDGIAYAYGPSDAMYGEMLHFESGVTGLALNIEKFGTGIVILGEDRKIKEGDKVYTTGKLLSIPVGDSLLGRVIDPMGNPLDGKGEIKTETTRLVETKASGIIDRDPVKEPLQTGIKAIDSMVPVGRGQRELIIGDRQTGKTAVAVDAILNQKDTDVIPIYVAIGQKRTTIGNVINTLEKYGLMEKTIVVAASASSPTPIQYIAPYSGVSIAEHFMYQGKHVLIIYDDLSKHAVAYRELSLLLRRPSGREAYPGDVFYLHSRLLERAAKLSKNLGGGSITALPIIETQAGDVSAYIPTNVISITDGQIYLDSTLFYRGVRPAVDVGLSVSRVGGNAQTALMKKVSGKLRLDLSQYRELAAFARFGIELDELSQNQLKRGERLVEILKQEQYLPLGTAEMAVAIYAATRGFMDSLPIEKIKWYEKEILRFIKRNEPELWSELSSGNFSDPLEKKLKAVLTRFNEERGE